MTVTNTLFKTNKIEVSHEYTPKSLYSRPRSQVNLWVSNPDGSRRLVSSSHGYNITSEKPHIKGKPQAFARGRLKQAIKSMNYKIQSLERLTKHRDLLQEALDTLIK